MSAITKSHASLVNLTQYEVINVLAPGKEDYLEAFERYRSSLSVANQGERLLENYGPDRFTLSDQLAIPVVFDRKTSQILGFSSIFRPSHWPEGTARVGNRTWIDREFRVTGPEKQNPVNQEGYIRTAAAFMELMFNLNHHICLEKGILLAVISRESKGHSISALARLAKRISNERLMWQTDEGGYYQTVPNGQSKECWQKIIFAELRPGARKLLSGISRLTIDSYAQRFLASPRPFDAS